MNISTLCLALLSCGDAAGYDIRKATTEGHFSHFLDASYGAIYPALSRMETDGLVTSRTEHTEGKPPRKVYSITGSGREALIESLHRPMRKDVFRSEFLMLTMFAEHLEPAIVTEAIERQLAFLRDDLAQIEEGAAEFDLGTVDWVAGYGRFCIRQQIDYIEGQRASIEAIAGRLIDDGGVVGLPLAAE